MKRVKRNSTNDKISEKDEPSKVPKKRRTSSLYRSKKPNAEAKMERDYAGWSLPVTSSSPCSDSAKYTSRTFIGVDEAGRGCSAGPVVSAACTFHDPRRALEADVVLRDSKTMSHLQREESFHYLMNLPSDTFEVYVCAASPSYIDMKRNIIQATMDTMYECVCSFSGISMLYGMEQDSTKHKTKDENQGPNDTIVTNESSTRETSGKKADVSSLSSSSSLSGLPLQTPGAYFVLIDGNIRPDWARDSMFVQYIAEEKADHRSVTVAAASICAKYIRDEIMKNVYAPQYIHYDLNTNFGYCTKRHEETIRQYGPKKGCHRMSYRYIQRLLEQHQNTPKDDGFGNTKEERGDDASQYQSNENEDENSQECIRYVSYISHNRIRLQWLDDVKKE